MTRETLSVVIFKIEWLIFFYSMFLVVSLRLNKHTVNCSKWLFLRMIRLNDLNRGWKAKGKKGVRYRLFLYDVENFSRNLLFFLLFFHEKLHILYFKKIIPVFCCLLWKLFSSKFQFRKLLFLFLWYWTIVVYFLRQIEHSFSMNNCMSTIQITLVVVEIIEYLVLVIYVSTILC